MNLGELSVRKNRVVFVLMFLVLLGGFVAYHKLGRLEDPEFTIKEALIITSYPGASAEEVAREVTNPIESACQQLGQLKRVESESTRGRSVVTAVIQDRYNKNRIPQVWDELRRKIDDVQSQLPPSVRGKSLVVDDFGDVYGVFLAITGKGFTQSELRRYTEFLRRELLLVRDVKKVDLFSEQQEVVFLEISRQRLAQLGINEEQIYSQLHAKNVAADGGRVRVGDEHIAVDPTGGFESAEDMLGLVIGSDRSGRQARARRRRNDRSKLRRSAAPLAAVRRPAGHRARYLDSAGRQRRDDGQPRPAQARRTETRPTGGNRDRRHQLPTYGGHYSHQCLHIQSGQGGHHRLRRASVRDGPRAGFIIGCILFLTIMGTFLVMYLDGNLLMERISLGAFIIALCMLTDNAIVVTEGIQVRIQSGEEKIHVIRDVISQNQWPLFGATSIAVVAFAAIGLSEDRTGEYCNSLFWVIFISLALSWVAAITFTPLLGYLMFKPNAGTDAERNPYGGFLFQTYRRFLVTALRFRWAVLAATLLLFAAALYGFRGLDQSFFPPATRPQFMVDSYLPAGSGIRDSEAYAKAVERYIQAQPGVTHVSSFIGGGGLRFLLVYTPERQNPAYVQFLVQVDDDKKINGLIAGIQKYLDNNYPNANTVAKKFLLGPGSGGRVQVRFLGPDHATLRQLAGQAQKIFEADGGAIGVRSDWREPEKVIRPDLLELQARRNGITRLNVAEALETSLEGRAVGIYREPGSVGTGVFPQEARLLPIVARPPVAERNDVGKIQSMQIWSPAARKMIPLSQVVSGAEIDWEDPVVMRRNRNPTITVHADPRSGLPSHLLNRVRKEIEQIKLPAGYSREWGGEYEDSQEARAALAKPLPGALILMVFIVVCLFNSIRSTLVVCLAVPLAIIGVTAGLLITKQPFGFMALLGVIALAGEQIKNSIVLVDEVYTQLDEGKPPYTALLDAGVSRLRPVLLVAVTTVLGMIPLLQDPFFVAMAATIMFGLAFACVLTMIVVPVLYSIFFRVREDAGTSPGMA